MLHVQVVVMETHIGNGMPHLHVNQNLSKPTPSKLYKIFFKDADLPTLSKLFMNFNIFQKNMGLGAVVI